MTTFKIGDFVTDDLNAYGEASTGAHLYVVMKILNNNMYLIGSKRWGLREVHEDNLDVCGDGVPRPHLTPSTIAQYWIQQLVEHLEMVA